MQGIGPAMATAVEADLRVDAMEAARRCMIELDRSLAPYAT
jgi:hypothetical protein